MTEPTQETPDGLLPDKTNFDAFTVFQAMLDFGLAGDTLRTSAKETFAIRESAVEEATMTADNMFAAKHLSLAEAAVVLSNLAVSLVQLSQAVEEVKTN